MQIVASKPQGQHALPTTVCVAWPQGVGWSEIPRYQFKVPEGWEEVPVSIAGKRQLLLLPAYSMALPGTDGCAAQLHALRRSRLQPTWLLALAPARRCCRPWWHRNRPEVSRDLLRWVSSPGQAGAPSPRGSWQPQ